MLNPWSKFSPAGGNGRHDGLKNHCLSASEFESRVGHMKFKQVELDKLHKTLRALNDLTLGNGDWHLPDRFGLQNTNGETEAIVSINNSNKYEIELISKSDIESHDEEVRSTIEVDQEAKDL